MVGLFSATYPHLVERVTMICPASRHPVDLLVSWCVVHGHFVIGVAFLGEFVANVEAICCPEIIRNS